MSGYAGWILGVDVHQLVLRGFQRPVAFDVLGIREHAVEPQPEPLVRSARAARAGRARAGAQP